MRLFPLGPVTLYLTRVDLRQHCAKWVEYLWLLFANIYTCWLVSMHPGRCYSPLPWYTWRRRVMETFSASLALGEGTTGHITFCNNLNWEAWSVDGWWRHQMETFSALLVIYAGNSPVPGPRPPVNSPHKGQWRGTLMFSLICAWTNRWEK